MLVTSVTTELISAHSGNRLNLMCTKLSFLVSQLLLAQVLAIATLQRCTLFFIAFTPMLFYNVIHYASERLLFLGCWSRGSGKLDDRLRLLYISHLEWVTLLCPTLSGRPNLARLFATCRILCPLLLLHTVTQCNLLPN